MSAPAVLLGQQTPRLHLVPPAVANRAQSAVDIYELSGQRLDDWQKLCLCTGCGLRADLNWASFENGVICQRQNGKGAIIAALSLASLFLWGNRETVYSAHRLDTAGKTFREIRGLIESTPDLARRVKDINDSDMVIVTHNGARLEFRTRTGSGGRGLVGDFVIMDEALELTPEQLAALGPIMLARPWAQFWYFSTVPAFGDQHLVTVRQRVLDGDTGLSWAEWGCNLGVRLDDPEALARANPALGIRITLERLHHLRKILGDEKFATECMGIWPGVSKGGVLDPRVWATLKDPGSRRCGAVALAINVNQLRDGATIGMFGYRTDGLEHVQVLDARAGVDWIPGRAAELAAALDPLGWAVEAKNGAYALREELAAVGIVEPEDPEQPRRGNLLVMSAAEASDAVAQFIDAYRRGVLRHVGQPDLDACARNVKARSIGDQGQIAWARRASGEEVGEIVTVTNARYLYVTWHDLVTAEYDVLASIPLADGQCPSCEAYAAPGNPIDHYEDCVTRREGRIPAYADA